MRIIFDIANLVAALLLGLYLFFLTVFGLDALRTLPDGIVRSLPLRLLLILISGGLLAANIRVLVQELKMRGLRGNLRLTTDHGMTEFSVPSLEMLILRDLKTEPDIVEPTVFLQPRAEGKPMLCKVELKLRRQKKILNRADEIKKKVRDIIGDLFPGGLTVDVLVDAREIVDEEVAVASRSSRSTRETPPNPKEFNGPVYTDGGGSDGV